MLEGRGPKEYLRGPNCLGDLISTRGPEIPVGLKWEEKGGSISRLRFTISIFVTCGLEKSSNAAFDDKSWGTLKVSNP